MSRSLEPVEALDHYSVFIAELEEIRRHKWIESEKAQDDIGFEKALPTGLTNIVTLGACISGWAASQRSARA